MKEEISTTLWSNVVDTRLVYIPTKYEDNLASAFGDVENMFNKFGLLANKGRQLALPCTHP